MKRCNLAAMVSALLITVGCTPREDAPVAELPAAAVAAADVVTTASVPVYANKVWKVTESKQVSPGDLRIFLSGGTLVMASDHATPALGSWTEIEGKLTIIEEGISYPTDVLESSADTLRLRMHSPGEPVEMLLKVATGAAAIAPPVALSFTGTVRHLDLEGGHYVIEAADGTRYQPIELPAAYQREGMRVAVQAVKRDDMMSIGMTGALIELRQIREQK